MMNLISEFLNWTFNESLLNFGISYVIGFFVAMFLLVAVKQCEERFKVSLLGLSVGEISKVVLFSWISVAVCLFIVFISIAASISEKMINSILNAIKPKQDSNPRLKSLVKCTDQTKSGK